MGATVIQYLGTENLKSIVAKAKSQSVNSAVAVISIIQNAINDGRLDNYLEDYKLAQLANFFLYGEKIGKYELNNGVGVFVEDGSLTKIAKQLWLEYAKSINDKKRKEEDKKERKPRRDNTGTNNQAGF